MSTKDPWTGDRPWRPPMRRVVALAVIVGLMTVAAVVGRLSAPAPGPGPSPPAQPGTATRMSGDVAVGFPRTRNGAVSAAASYATVLAGPLILDPERYRAAELALVAPAARDRITADGERAISAVDESTHAITEARRGTPVVVRYVPVAYHIAAYDDHRAAVSLWGLWLVAERDVLAPTQTWSTTTLTLEWVGDDWKLVSSTASPGPTPQLGQPATASPALPAQLTDFEEYTHASR